MDYGWLGRLMAKARRNPSRLPGTFRSRVFVGGSYCVASKAGAPPRQVLDEIRAVVVGAKLDPILADEFVVARPVDETHHDAIYLLHACRTAIVEISDLSGALMELERTTDYGTQCLVLYNDPALTGWRLSRMLSSYQREFAHRVRLFGYTGVSDLRSATYNWLSEMVNHGHAAPP